MSCRDCEQFQAQPERTSYVKVGTGNVEIRGCRKHLGELLHLVERGRELPGVQVTAVRPACPTCGGDHRAEECNRPLPEGNKFQVAAGGDSIVLLRPVPARLSKAEAVEFAAWIVALAVDDDEAFWAMLDAVRAT